MRRNVNNFVKRLKKKRRYRTLASYKIHVNVNNLKEHLDEYWRWDVDPRDLVRLASEFGAWAQRGSRPWLGLLNLFDSHRTPRGSFLEQYKNIPERLVQRSDVPRNAAWQPAGFERVDKFRDDALAQYVITAALSHLAA